MAERQGVGVAEQVGGGGAGGGGGEAGVGMQRREEPGPEAAEPLSGMR